MAYQPYKSIFGDLPTATQNAVNTATPKAANTGVAPAVTSQPRVATVTPTRVATTSTPGTTLPRGQYMTGSGIQKAMDILQTPQYAVAAYARGGLLNQKKLAESRGGKAEVGDIFKNALAGFKYIPQGIKERSSFSDYAKEAGVKNPALQATLGLAGDILLDPTTYMGFGVLDDVLKGAAKVTKLDKAGAAIRKIPVVKNVVDNLGEKFIYRYGQAPEYASRAEKLIKDIGQGADEAVELGSSLKYAPKNMEIFGQTFKKGEEFPIAIQQRLSQMIRGGISSDEALTKVSTPVVEKFKNLATEQTKLGVAPEETFSKYFGQYLPTYYREFMEKKGISTGNKFVTERLAKKGSLEDLGRAYLQSHGEEAGKIAKRTKSELEMLGKKFQEEAGLVKEAAYPAARGIAEESKNVALAKYYDYVGKQFAKDFADEGLVKLPQTEKLGAISGKWVPKYIRDEISSLGALPKNENALSGIVEGTKKFMTKYWKPGKTVLNPGQQVRNVLSNFVLNDLVGGTGTWKQLPDAIKEIKNGGKYYNEAKQAGVFRTTFAKNEIDSLLTDLGKVSDLKSPKKILGKLDDLWGKAVGTGAGIQQKSEELGKLMQFIYQRKAGKTVQEAANAAEKALFNYSKITPFEKGIRSSLIPFYTFTRKSVPLVAETAWKNPGRLTKYRKVEQAVENLTPNREGERRLLPNWMKDQVRIPGTKNKYLSTSYIYPWGNIFGSGYLPFGFNVPGYDIASKALSGYDPYFQKKLDTESSPLAGERVMGRVNAILRTLEPTVGSATIEKLIPAIMGKKDYAGRTRNVGQVLVGDIMGIKTYDFDVAQANTNQQNAIKAIATQTTTQINRTIKDQSMTPEQKARRIKLLLMQKNKDTLKILKGQ